MAQNPVAWNDTSPAAPAGSVNVKFQADAPNVDPSVPRNASAYMPPMTASVGGAVPTPPNDSTKFLNGQGAWTTPAGGGGGGTGDLALAFDSHPASPDSHNDEFESTSLNGAWTVVANTVASVDYDGAVRGAAYVKFSGNQNYVIAKSFAPGSADFSVTLKAGIKFLADVDQIELAVTDVATELWSGGGGINGNGILIGHVAVHSAVVDFYTEAGTAGSVAFDSGANLSSLARDFGAVYLHIQRVSGVWSCWYSLTGYLFTQTVTDPTFNTGFTISKIVISMNRRGSTGKNTGFFDFLRVNQIFF